MKDFVEPDLVRFARVKDKDVAFFLALPDLNQALHLAYPRPGEPELFTLLKVLWYWKVAKKVTGQRVVFMGVEPEWRAKGLEGAMMLDFIHDTIRLGKYFDTDSGWVLESNQPIIQLWITFKADLYKKYRFL